MFHYGNIPLIPSSETQGEIQFIGHEKITVSSLWNFYPDELVQYQIFMIK